MSDSVLVEVDDHVALITVNDPDRRNAVTKEISAALRAAVDAAEANVDVHALIVTGAGKAFCAGATSPRWAKRPRTAYAPFTTASSPSPTVRCRRSLPSMVRLSAPD